MRRPSNVTLAKAGHVSGLESLILRVAPPNSFDGVPGARLIARESTGKRVCPCHPALYLSSQTHARHGGHSHTVGFWIPAPDQVEGRPCAGMTTRPVCPLSTPARPSGSVCTHGTPYFIHGGFSGRQRSNSSISFLSYAPAYWPLKNRSSASSRNRFQEASSPPGLTG